VAAWEFEDERVKENEFFVKLLKTAVKRLK
jgi:hypothetical protein